ncbi:MAG: polysaccharide biosynthesis protein PslG [Thermoleophilaceae bacterium]|nr:polysaccharide biosynthesis protein PslG [Thermoleophilaceae bacterium]
MKILLTCLALCAFAAAPAAAQAQTVPPSFFSTNWDGEIAKNAGDQLRDAEWKRMTDTGVGSTRTNFDWVTAEPRKGVYRWTTIDDLVSVATRNRIELLPVVMNAPPWARERSGNFGSPPKDPNDYASFVTALIQRYGPDGLFWTLHPELEKRPLRIWQIWNEPHLKFQWDSKPGEDYAKGYGKLLRVAYKAIHKADPGAQVVLAGLANRSYAYLASLYRRGKIHGFFDVAALHPYTVKASGVIELTKRFKGIMRKFHDSAKPVWITELGLPASKKKIKSNSTLQTTDAGLAKFITASYRALVKARGSNTTRVDRVYQYTWASVYCCEQFRFTGLLQYDNKDSVEPKPAYQAYLDAARQYGAAPPAPAARSSAW